MKFYIVDQISQHMEMWPVIRTHLKTAEEHHSFMTVDGLLQSVIHGHAKLVIGVDDAMQVRGACAIEVLSYPTMGMVLNVFMAGTAERETEHLLECFQFLRKYAQNSGFAGISFMGRPGWKKWVPKMGLNVEECVYAWERFRPNASNGDVRPNGSSSRDAATAGHAPARNAPARNAPDS